MRDLAQPQTGVVGAGDMTEEERRILSQPDPNYDFLPEEMRIPTRLEHLRRQRNVPVNNGEPTTEAIKQLMLQRQNTADPDDIKQIDNLINNMQLSANAPMNTQALKLAQQGQGLDTLIGHLEEGDVVIPPDMLTDDPEFESYLEQKFVDYDINPEDRVATTGIAGIYNPITGAQQFGFIKKIAKGLKKVVKVVAPIAQFIPGPIGAAASLYNKANTVLRVAKGKANPLALLTVAGPLRTGQSIGDSIKGLSGGIGSIGTQITSGFQKFLGDPTGTISGLFKSQNPADYTELDTGEFVNKITGDTISAADFGNLASRSGSGIQRLTRGLQGGLFGTEGLAGGVTPGTGAAAGTYTDAAGNVYSQQQMVDAGLVNATTGKLVQQAAGQFMPTGQQQGGGLLGGLLGGGQGGGMLGGLGSLAQLGIAGGVAGKLGQMAYDEAKDQKGVSLSPVVAMDATGRYNLEAEIARRMGQQAPNPTEFGLLPANTFPELSGGQPRTAAHGGAIMAYAQGGDVSVAEYNKMNGSINGEGTETSDDIPAMLSDGEFVMTGQAVRGAGSYDMNNNSGILTLTPSGDASRDTGTDLMYQLMEAFSSQAQPA